MPMVSFTRALDRFLEAPTVAADGATLSASAGKPGVYAGGDCVSGPASIIEAIAAGRKAAANIDKFLGGKGEIDQPLAPPEVDILVWDLPAKADTRVAMPCIPLSNRTCGFAPVEVGYSGDAAVKEAWRCLSCDARTYAPVLDGEACKECGYCVEVCSLGVYDKGDKFNAKGFRFYTAAHPERCVGCNLCFYSCPDFAIEVKEA